MRKVTSVTTFKMSAGTKMSITYSEIDESGNIIKENVRIQKIIVNEDDEAKINIVNDIAQGFVDAE